MLSVLKAGSLQTQALLESEVSFRKLLTLTIIFPNKLVWTVARAFSEGTVPKSAFDRSVN